jgi:hypothetical protein
MDRALALVVRRLLVKAKTLPSSQTNSCCIFVSKIGTNTVFSTSNLVFFVSQYHLRTLHTHFFKEGNYFYEKG